MGERPGGINRHPVNVYLGDRLVLARGELVYSGGAGELLDSDVFRRYLGDG